MTGSGKMRYIRFREVWRQSRGSLVHRSWGKPQRTTWLAERAANRGGKWGMGCLCAGSVQDALINNIIPSVCMCLRIHYTLCYNYVHVVIMLKCMDT